MTQVAATYTFVVVVDDDNPDVFDVTEAVEEYLATVKTPGEPVEWEVLDQPSTDYQAQVDPDGTLPEEERRRRAGHARNADYARRALKAMKDRRLAQG